MTRRGSIVIYGALLLFAAAALLVSSSAASLGALALLILFPLLSTAWNAFVRRTVRAAITVPAIASKGERVAGSVRVACGRGCIPAGHITVSVCFENELTGTVQTIPLVLQAKRGGYAADFSWTSRHCGCVHFTLRSLMLSDAFDLVRLRCAADASARCTVLPNTFAVEIDDPALPNDTGEADTFLDVGGGSDFTEVYRLREYVPGDSVRGMHWKLSSKLDTLLYRDPNLAVQRSLLLYWDKSPADPDVADALAEAVFSVSQAISALGIAFTLAVPEALEVRLRTVTDEETLLQTLPLLLRGTAQTASQPDVTQFGRTLWFTSKADAPAWKTLTLLLCTAKPNGAENGIVFTPENVQRALRRLDWNYER